MPPNQRSTVKRPADRLPRKKPRTVTVGIVFDDQVALEHQRADEALTAAREDLERSYPRRVAARASTGDEHAEQTIVDDDAAALAPLAADLEEKLAALDAATVWFVFQGLPADKLRELAKAHPPTDEDVEENKLLGGEPLQWSPTSFPEELVRLTCVSPKGVDWDEVFHGEESAWGALELAALVSHAVHASQSVRTATHRPAPVWKG
jgi:hypothetical protein